MPLIIIISLSRRFHHESLEEREVKEELQEDNEDLQSNLANLRKKIGKTCCHIQTNEMILYSVNKVTFNRYN